MGNSASKQRVLPGASRTTFIKPITQNRVSLQQKASEPHVSPPQKQSPLRDNVNVSKIGQIRVEEVPLKLDQNHSALKTLRNRSQLEKLLKEANESSSETTKHSVHPSTFVAIVEDLNHYSPEEVRERYNLGTEFVTLLKSSKVQTAKQRVEKKKRNVKKEQEEQRKKDLDRMNGMAGQGHVGLESALEDLLGHPK